MPFSRVTLGPCTHSGSAAPTVDEIAVPAAQPAVAPAVPAAPARIAVQAQHEAQLQGASARAAAVNAAAARAAVGPTAQQRATTKSTPWLQRANRSGSSSSGGSGGEVQRVALRPRRSLFLKPEAVARVAPGVQRDLSAMRGPASAHVVTAPAPTPAPTRRWKLSLSALPRTGRARFCGKWLRPHPCWRCASSGTCALGMRGMVRAVQLRLRQPCAHAFASLGCSLERRLSSPRQRPG